jgi:hypothetical protein
MSIKILKRKKKKKPATHCKRDRESHGTNSINKTLEMTSYVKQLGKQKQMPK